MSTGQDFATLIRREMDRSNLSIRALAAQLGVNKDTVLSWRQGANEPELKRLRPIADALDIDVAELVGGTTDAKGRDARDAIAIVMRLAASRVPLLAKELEAATPDLLEVLADAERYVQRQGNRG